MTKHGGKRNGAGSKPTPFFSRTERLAFKDDAERAAYMSLSSRERVVLALWAAKVMATTPPAK